VFDSTLAETFTATPWDNRLLILEWTNEDRVCRCTMHTAWTQADVDDNQTLTYDNYITPENGELQAECWYKMPKRVTSIRVGVNYMEKQAVALAEGYNMKLTHLTTSTRPVLNLTAPRATRTLIPGTRKINRIVLDASPGNGKGTVPANCTDTSVRAINGIGANDYNNFNLDAEGCVRIKRPVMLTNLEPREFDYATDADRATLAFNNNCKNCCDCESFARTYQGIKRQWFLYRNVADLATDTRDRYEDNRARWLEQKAARAQDNFNIRLSLDGNGNVRWGFSFCNVSKCCLIGLNAWMFWRAYLDDLPVIPNSNYCGPASFIGDDFCGVATKILPTTYQPTGGDVLNFKWNRSDPQTTTTLSGRHCFPDAKGLAKGRYKVNLYMFITWTVRSPDPTTGDPCLYNQFPLVDLPADIQETLQTLELEPDPIYSVKETEYKIVDPTNPYCNRCNCE
jgi:hypothetical protein